LERRVAATYLARMLTGDTAPELGGRQVVRVAFQQAATVAVDDLVVLAAHDGESDPSLQVAIAVRRRPNLVRSDEATAKLVVSMVRALGQMGDQTADLESAIVLAAAGSQIQMTQLAELASHARSHHDADSFFAMFDPPGQVTRETSARLDQLVALVGSAITEVEGIAEPGLAGVRERTWQLLVRLHVLRLQLEEPDTVDWADAQNRLRTIAAGEDLSSAAALLDRLESLAGEYAPRAATVDAAMLRRDVHPLLESGAGRSRDGWSALQGLDEQARIAVGDHVGGAAGRWHIDRVEEVDDLLDQADATPVLVVGGNSGVGKSALALAAAERARSAGRHGEPAEATALNLRQLPDTVLTFEHALGTPLDGLLSQMSAPHRYLVVDAADAAAESRDALLMYIISAAVRAGVRAIVVSSTDGQPAVEEVLGRLLDTIPEPYVVLPLDDAIIDELAVRFPRLGRLARSPRSRELLRRLVVVDLLLRSEITDIPMSAADAMRDI
jgi:hypothetical protein